MNCSRVSVHRWLLSDSRIMRRRLVSDSSESKSPIDVRMNSGSLILRLRPQRGIIFHFDRLGDLVHLSGMRDHPFFRTIQ